MMSNVVIKSLTFILGLISPVISATLFLFLLYSIPNNILSSLDQDTSKIGTWGWYFTGVLLPFILFALTVVLIKSLTKADKNWRISLYSWYTGGFLFPFLAYFVILSGVFFGHVSLGP